MAETLQLSPEEWQNRDDYTAYAQRMYAEGKKPHDYGRWLRIKGRDKPSETSLPAPEAETSPALPGTEISPSMPGTETSTATRPGTINYGSGNQVIVHNSPHFEQNMGTPVASSPGELISPQETPRTVEIPVTATEDDPLRQELAELREQQRAMLERMDRVLEQNQQILNLLTQLVTGNRAPAETPTEEVPEETPPAGIPMDEETPIAATVPGDREPEPEPDPTLVAPPP